MNDRFGMLRVPFVVSDIAVLVCNLSPFPLPEFHFLPERVMTTNMEVGTLTPPVGLNLCVAAGLTGVSLGQVTRAAIPWMFVLIAALLLITYIPWLSLFLVNLLY